MAASAWTPTRAEDPVRFDEVADWRLDDASFVAAFRLPPKDDDGALASKHPFPRTHRIVFDADSHTYTIDGHVAPRSVTGLLHAYCNDFDPERALAAMRASGRWEERCAELEARGLGTTDTDFVERWRFSGQVARDRGTLLHWHAEQAANGRVIQEPSPEFKQVLQLFECFARLGWAPYRTELSIFHCGLRCAGQMDLLCTDSQGHFVIVDYKRTKELPSENAHAALLYPLDHLPDAAWWKYSLQQNLYRYILISEYQCSVASMWLACVHPELAGPRLVQVPEMLSEIEALVEHERAQGRATESMPLDSPFTLL